MAKVYISCHAPEPANALAAQLKTAGHEVVSDWHTETEPRPPLSAADEWNRKAIHNVNLIESANVLVVLCDGQPHPGGKWVEAGIAWPQKPVFVLGEVENGMSHLFTRVRDVSGLIEAIRYHG